MFTISNVRKQANLKLAYQRLTTNPESTYKNYFRDLYNAYAMALDENIKNISTKINAGYMPEYSIRVFMPKSNGLSRMYTLLSVEDQIVYQAFANIIAEAISIPRVKRRYKKSVFGNLLTNQENIFFYQPWQDSYKAYTRAVIKAYQAGYDYIASFDLTACYDSINHDLLKKTLVGYKISENCASEFIRLIGKWESSDGVTLGTGIPQGPQASGIIAEVVLSSYDEYVEDLQKKYDFKYFRYVDDIKILSKNEEIVKWVLFLLDKKSKELGLFPQASKIAVHKIDNIDDEVKRISKPLFDDEFDETQKYEYARKSVMKMLKSEHPDLTSIKRYFHCVDHNAKTNRVAIQMVEKYPNMIHSFAYYVLRYPRTLPKTITDYVYACCIDKTKQFAAGILLEAILFKINKTDQKRFLELAKKLLSQNKKDKFIVDCRFKAQLLLNVVLYGNLSENKVKNLIFKTENWWVIKEVLSRLQNCDKAKIILPNLVKYGLIVGNSDISLISANAVVLEHSIYILPQNKDIVYVAQNTLKRAGLIQRSIYTNSQINKYISEITNKMLKFPWKKHLGKEHDQLERNIFQAHSYWKTDLTAFVNLWDTIDDRLCSVVVQAHPELGGYSLGNVGGIAQSANFYTHLPQFHKMVKEIHALRLKSHLSHSKVKYTNNYTGPILQKERKRIKELIVKGLDELVAYW